MPKERKVIIKSLIDAGNSETWTAEVMGCSRWMVRKVKASMEGDEKFITWYRANRAKVLAKVQMDNLALHEVLIGSVTPEEIEGMSSNEKAAWVRNTMVNAGIAYDKERLENDLSTENVDKRLNVIMQLKREDRALEGG
jgi:hypothetical protein